MLWSAVSAKDWSISFLDARQARLLRNSAALGMGTALVSTLIGAPLGVALARVGIRGKALLRVALSREPEVPEAYTQLAMAYGRKGDLAQADLASAQAAFYRGDNRTARQLAGRAKTRLPIGSPAWVRADDLANIKAGPGEN